MKKFKKIQKKISVLLCICFILQLFPASLTNAEELKKESLFHIQDNIYATPSNTSIDIKQATDSNVLLENKKEPPALEEAGETTSLDPVIEITSGEQKLDEDYYLEILCIGNAQLKAEKEVYIEHLTVSSDVVIDAASYTIYINDFTWISGKITVKGKVEFGGDIKTIEEQNNELILDNSSNVHIADEIKIGNMTCIGGSQVKMESAYVKNLEINGSTTIIAGEDNITVTKVNWKSGKVVMEGKIIFGGNVYVSRNGNGELICREKSDVIINGNLDMSICYDGQSIVVNCEKGSKLTVSGNVIGHKRGGGFMGYWYPHIYLNGNITIWGDFDFNAKEVYMNEEEAYVFIYGDYKQQMGTSLGDMWGEDCLFSAGTLEVKGDYLYDSSGNSNFLSGTHTTIFSGNKKQMVYGILKNVEVKNTSAEGVEFNAISTTGFGGTVVHHTKIYGTLCVDKNSVIQGSSTEAMLHNKVTLLEITAAPDKMLYLPGEAVSGKGMELQVTYQNGERRPTYGGWTIKTDMDANLGKIPIEIEFGGKTVPFNVVSEEEGTVREGNIITYNHHKYRLFADYLPWEEVEKKCEELGGYPAVITSQEELDMIVNLINKYSGFSGMEKLEDVWIGLYRDEDTKSWTWVTDEQYEYANWNKENSSSGDDKNNTVINCTGIWNPTYKNLAYPYICEWDGEAQKPSSDTIYDLETFYPASVAVNYKPGILSKEDKKLPGIPSAIKSRKEKEQYKNELLHWATEFGYGELFTEKYLDMFIDGELSYAVMEVYPTEEGMYKKENEQSSVAEYMRDIIFLSTLHNSTVDWNKSYVDKFDPESYTAGEYKTKYAVTLEKMKEVHDRAFSMIDRYVDYMQESDHDPFNNILHTSFSTVESLEELNTFHKAIRLNDDLSDAIKKTDELYRVVDSAGIEIPATITSVNQHLQKGKNYLSYGNDLIKLYKVMHDKEPSMTAMLEFLTLSIRFIPTGKGKVGELGKKLKTAIIDTLNMAINASTAGPFFMHMYLSQDEDYIKKYVIIDEKNNSSLDVVALLADSSWKDFSRHKTMQSVVQSAVDGLGLEGMPDNLIPSQTEQVLYCVSIINAGEKFDSRAVREQFIRHLAQIIEREKEQEGISSEKGKYRVEIKCPVNVSVYQKDICIGSIIDGKIENRQNEKIWLNAYGEDLDKKVIEFFDFEDFKIEFEPTGTGTMDLFIRQYNALNVHQKTAGFQEVSLSVGKQMSLFLELKETFPDYLKLQVEDEGKEITPTLFITDKDWTGEPETVELLEEGIILEKGDIYKIPRVISPITADEKYIQWESSNPACASVDDAGNIMAKKMGTATVSALINETVLASVSVEVVQRLESLQIICDKNQLVVGEKIRLDVKSVPEDADYECNWVSENPEIVSVDAFGNVTANAEGMAILKAYSQQDNRSTFFTFTVKLKEESFPNDTKPEENEKPEESKPSDREENPEEIKPPSGGEKPGVSNSKGKGNSRGSSSNNSEQFGKIINLSYIYSGTWENVGEKWKFVTSDGNFIRSAWIYDKEKWYIIGQDGFMLTGWQLIDGEWYYFNLDGSMSVGWIIDDFYKYYLNPLPNGSRGKMLTGWQFIDGKWYFLNPVSDGTKGRLFIRTITPDGYKVDEDGAWIP